MTFTREDRYLVLKRSDIEAGLTPHEQVTTGNMETQCNKLSVRWSGR